MSELFLRCFLETLGLIIIGAVGYFFWSRSNRRNKGRNFEVYTFQLWYKISFIVFCFFFAAITVSYYYSKGTFSEECIGFAIFTAILVITTIIVWTARVRLVGATLIKDNFFMSRSMDIDSLCKVSEGGWWMKEHYVVVNSRGKKMYLSYFLLGVEKLVRQIEQTTRPKRSCFELDDMLEGAENLIKEMEQFSKEKDADS